MNKITTIFEALEKLSHEDGLKEFTTAHKDDSSGPNRKIFLNKIFTQMDNLILVLKSDETLLISVKNQKILRSCFQIITAIGISPCLLPGLGISLKQRFPSAALLPSVSLSDDTKYELLSRCLEFFTRCYAIPVLKSIIITFHLCDYLSMLIQLSFAPLKKPGVYATYTMSTEMYEKLSTDREKFVQIYNHLVTNCFQPILMKELLVLQSITGPAPPMFVKRVVSQELSRRLLQPGGLLSLIRCFIESYNVDTGYDWNKIEMICKIISTRHGKVSEDEYLANITSQISQILSSSNMHYLTVSVACVLSLFEKYPKYNMVTYLVDKIFKTFDFGLLQSKCQLPNTVVLTTQEIESNINILHTCACNTNMNCPQNLLTCNTIILFQLGLKCSKSQEIKTKINEILLKILDTYNEAEMLITLDSFLFGKQSSGSLHLSVEEFDAGLSIKCTNSKDYPQDEAVAYFLELLRAAGAEAVGRAFGAALRLAARGAAARAGAGVEVGGSGRGRSRDLLALEDAPAGLGDLDQRYATTLQLLTEMSAYPSVVASIKRNPTSILEFIEYFLVENTSKENEECVTISLVLLNIVANDANQSEVLKDQDLLNNFNKLVPVLKTLSEDKSSLNHLLCEEALSLIESEHPVKSNSGCEKAIEDVFDPLLPVRAHGIMELTKLIEAKDPETISKKHYIFCLFQEQLKDADSYVYLSSIGGLAALGAHCADAALPALCAEYVTSRADADEEERRMKVGDVLVKVTRKLGDMALPHKAALLNAALAGSRERAPPLRASALALLAELSRALHYRLGTVLYEVLLCVRDVIETDEAVECRRAAVMVITALLQGLGRDTLLQLRDSLLPLYRTLKRLYSDHSEDAVVRLHAQMALEELNDIVKDFLFPEVKMEKRMFLLDN